MPPHYCTSLQRYSAQLTTESCTWLGPPLTDKRSFGCVLIFKSSADLQAPISTTLLTCRLPGKGFSHVFLILILAENDVTRFPVLYIPWPLDLIMCSFPGTPCQARKVAYGTKHPRRSRRLWYGALLRGALVPLMVSAKQSWRPSQV